MKGKTFNSIKSLPEFEKELKVLSKKFKTLRDDLEIFIEKQLKLYHILSIDNGGIFKISNLGIEYPRIYKAKKFACKSLKGRGSASGIRIIYACYGDNTIEFIEIYYKGEKDMEDRARILRYYRKK